MLLHATLQRFSDAVDSLEKTRRLAPNDFEVKRSLAYAYFGARNYKEALQVYKPMVPQLEPKDFFDNEVRT